MLKITQVRSTIGVLENQKRTLQAIGLKKIGQTVEKADNPCIRGMIFKVKHLVKVEEV